MFSIRKKTDIQSSLSPFFVAEGYKVRYPDILKEALALLYSEYNNAFSPCVSLNREWSTDYQFALSGDGTPCNFCVQIDMVGSDEKFLKWSIESTILEVQEQLRRRIFEIENSIAMYQFLERIFIWGNEKRSYFRDGWRVALDCIRKKTGKKIALLAVTKQKWESMMFSEFGKNIGETITKEEVFDLSGFDMFLGPTELFDLFEREGVEEFVFFVRSSDPTSKLKHPNVVFSHPVLENKDLRKIVKAGSLTFNIDNPSWSPIDQSLFVSVNGIKVPRLINDTKWYLPFMGMAFPVYSENDPLCWGQITDEFSEFCARLGVFLADEHQEKIFRFKPAQGTYGGYGHLRGFISDSGLRKELRREIRKRGPYLVQPEFEIPTILDNDGNEYSYIDRLFFAYIDGRPVFIGGLRNMIPNTSLEVKAGRVHGNKEAVWGEIL